MLDLNFLRDHRDEALAGLNKRGVNLTHYKILMMRDADHRRTMGEVQTLQARRNELSGEIGKLMQGGQKADAEMLKGEVTQIKARLTELAVIAEDQEKTVRHLLASLPNIPDPGVPVGRDETANVEIRRGTHAKPTFDFEPKQHFEIGEGLEGMDFETAAAMSGSRFVITSGEIARLERALGQFMLDQHVDWNGYREVNPPVLVRENALFGTGQLPKFEDDLFKTTDGRYLIPTAEVSLTNMVAGQIIDEPHPLRRYAALTQCFRAEAGSAGRDTRGMIRQHQFAKVELVSITGTPPMPDYNEELERMLGAACSVLDALGLHYRVMLLCTGDMGFTAKKTYDIEVWLPGQNAYREISSVSYCGDFQARRMNARYRPKDGKGTAFLHTYNGSGVAVGRALVAVLENFQNADGTVNVPKALNPYMRGELNEQLVIGSDE